MQPKWNKNDHRKGFVDNKLIEMICLDMQPFSIVDDIGFRNFVSALQPSYYMPTRQEISKTRVPELYKSVEAKVKDNLLNLSSMALTIDHWTSRANESYMAVTAHGLTENFQLIDFCLDAKQLSESHTGQYIADEIQLSLNRWAPSLNTKKIYITNY